MKTLIIFDLDGTLAKSKQPIESEMATLLSRLLDVVKVAIISGGATLIAPQTGWGTGTPRGTFLRDAAAAR